MLPAVGQGAIAIQCRAEDAPVFAAALDSATARAVNIERAIQAVVGGGCQIAFAAHVVNDTLHFFHEKTGIRTVALVPVTGSPSGSHGAPGIRADCFSNWYGGFPPDQVITSTALLTVAAVNCGAATVVETSDATL